MKFSNFVTENFMNHRLNHLNNQLHSEQIPQKKLHHKEPAQG